MILSLERLGADLTRVLALVAVDELVLGERARVIERLAADCALDDSANDTCAHGLHRATFATLVTHLASSTAAAPFRLTSDRETAAVSTASSSYSSVLILTAIAHGLIKTNQTLTVIMHSY